MIRSIKVEGLNDQLDFNLEFNKDLNIFTGANGCGKTTMLKLIWYLISGNLHRISPEIPFKSVSIQTNQFFLSLQKFKPKPKPSSQPKVNGVRQRGARGGSTKPKIRINWRSKERTETHEVNVQGFSTKAPILTTNNNISSLPHNSLFFPTFRRIEGGFSIDRNAVHTEDAAVVRLLSSTTEMLQTAMSRLSEDLSSDRHKFITSVSTMDIEDLLPLKKSEIAEKINELYAELSSRIGKKVTSSDTFKFSGEYAISALEHIQEDLFKAGKTREKLENRMTVLNETINIIFRREIQVANGLTLGEKNGRQGSVIQADKLSSGEKQMLGFLCYNAFSDNTVIFIDEPELSLHQDWQDILLPLLLKQDTGNQFFVATHSEFIYDQFPHKEFILNLEETNA